MFGLEIQSHLFQMFPVEFIGKSYCATLKEENNKKKYGIVPSQTLQTGKGIHGIYSLPLP